MIAEKLKMGLFFPNSILWKDEGFLKSQFRK